MRSGKCSRTRPGSSTLPTAMPASAISDPANSAAVPGTSDRTSWPAISASRVSTTVRCEPSRAASTGAARPITANANVGSDSSTPVVAAGSPVAVPQFRDDGAERVDHRPQVDRQQQDRGADQPPGRFAGRLRHLARIGVPGRPDRDGPRPDIADRWRWLSIAASHDRGRPRGWVVGFDHGQRTRGPPMPSQLASSAVIVPHG